jgi:hypothetical protein
LRPVGHVSPVPGQQWHVDGEPGIGQGQGQAAHGLRVPGEAVEDQGTAAVTGGRIGLCSSQYG